jgi:hypothetical protein
MPVLPVGVPGYAGGGPAAAAGLAVNTAPSRSVVVNVGGITNAVPEPASVSLYRVVRRAVDGEVN